MPTAQFYDGPADSYHALYPDWRRRGQDQRPQAAHRRRRYRSADRAGHRSRVQDRDGARPLLWNLLKAFRTAKQPWGGSGYAGKLVTWARVRRRLKLQIVRRTELHKFIVLPAAGW